jgi:hypothetical protein
MQKECCEPGERSEVVKIAGIIAGILLVIVVMFLVFAREQMVAVLPTITWALVVLGIVLGAFTIRKQKKK